MSDFFSAFDDRYSALLEDWRSRQEPEYERSFLERVFAPFEAPQQTLFSFTKSKAEGEGTGRALWEAISHGARYFNPWSNEKPIDPDEMRQLFFGDEAEGFVKTTQNLAVSLLYDPLIFTGFLKGATAAGRLGKGAEQAVNALGKVLNPAEAVIDGMVLASKNVVGPLASTAAVKVLGEERATRWGTQLAQNFFNKYHGVDEAVIELATQRDANIYRWREEAFRIMKQGEELGGRQAQRLLTEALELDAAYIQMSGGKLSRDMQRKLDALNVKVDRLGIDRDQFWSTYRRYRELDDQIGRELLNLGAITGEQFAELQGTHLRRIYQAVENPLDYAKRVEDLNIPDVVQANKKLLYDNLNRFRDDLSDLRRAGTADQPAMFGVAEALGLGDSPNVRRYFDDGHGRFNVGAFVDDLDEWLTTNSASSIDDVLNYVRDVMLEGVNLPAEFNKTIANYISGALYEVKGSQYYADMIRGWASNPAISWNTYRERLEVVSRRSGIPEEIREAMGEVLEAAPRLASQVNEAGQLLETRRFLDTLAGVRRVDEETLTLLQRASQAGFSSDEGRNLMEQVARKLEMSVDELAEDVPRLLDEGVGARVGSKGTDWASVEANAARGHTYQIPDDESFGEMAGMWVRPSVGMLVTKLEGVDMAFSHTQKVRNKTWELIAAGTGLFKEMKVLLDPTAQVRNFIGNAVLMDMAGVSPLRLDLLNKARRELVQYAKTGKPGRFMQLADEAGVGLFHTTFSKAELQKFATTLASDPESIESWKDVFTKAHAVLAEATKGVRRGAARAFEFNEQLFKMTVFINRVEQLQSAMAKAGKVATADDMRRIAKQAAAAAEQALFNYADVPYMIDFIRRHGIVPFITFPMKATSFVAQTLYQHPHRVLKYDRIVDQVNAHVAGSSEDAAREIAALPQHAREAMVVRLPFEDAQGRPQYLDLSYFMPWAVLEDFKATLEPSEDRGAGAGFREGMMTPPGFNLYDAIRYNRDSMGRPIVDPSRSAAQNFQAIGHFLWQFIAPPSAPGGSRADSIGRALQAMARNSPEPVDWAEHLGRAWRRPMGLLPTPLAEERVFTSDGFTPQMQAQMGRGPLTGSEGGWAAFEGFLSGTLLGGSMASDTTQAARHESVRYSVNRTQAYKDIAAIRSNPSMSVAEKNARIRRILDALQKSSQESARNIQAML